MEEQNGLRLYFFVMYNLSGIQKGIQCGHAALEYADVYGETEQYREFIDNHKTFILLDGGGSNEMMDHCEELRVMGIHFTNFHEPDLNNSMSAIAFLLKESQYDCKHEADITFDYEHDEWLRHPEKRVYDYIRRFRLASN